MLLRADVGCLAVLEENGGLGYEREVMIAWMQGQRGDGTNHYDSDGKPFDST